MIADCPTSSEKAPVYEFRHLPTYKVGSKCMPIFFTKGSELSSKFGNAIHSATATQTNELLVNVLFKCVNEEYPLPSGLAMSIFSKTYAYLTEKGIEINSYSPISEGGILMVFNHDHSHFQIEIDNDEDIVLYKETNNEPPSGWDLKFDTVFAQLDAVI